MIYRLRHATTYEYAQPVVLGTHFMHLLPRERPGQTIREAQLDISPAPDSRRDETDHFGNFTTTVSLAGAHKQFIVALHATVEVRQPAPPAPENTPRWEAIAARSLHDFTVAEFCLPSPLARPDSEIANYAAVSFPPGRTILAALMELNLRIWTDMTYRGGVTNNATTASHILLTRTGVCQDYAHLMLACLRALGLPGRYISGYLRTSPPAGQVNAAAPTSPMPGSPAGLARKSAGWISTPRTICWSPTNT